MILAWLKKVGGFFITPRFLFWAQFGAQALGIVYLILGLVVMIARRPLGEIVSGQQMMPPETVGPWTGWEVNAAFFLILGLSGVISATFFALHRESPRAPRCGPSAAP